MQQQFLDFQANVEQLLQQCSELLEQNASLRRTNEEQRNEIMRSHEELEVLKRKYKHLQTAHALSAQTEDKEQAKRRLTILIQMVDKAIDQLSE